MSSQPLFGNMYKLQGFSVDLQKRCVEFILLPPLLFSDEFLKKPRRAVVCSSVKGSSRYHDLMVFLEDDAVASPDLALFFDRKAPYDADDDLDVRLVIKYTAVEPTAPTVATHFLGTVKTISTGKCEWSPMINSPVLKLDK